MLKHVVLSAALCLPLLTPTTSDAALTGVIDFDALVSNNTQQVPLSGFSEDGFTFALSFAGRSLGPAIFDTNCVGSACNGDFDLVPAAQGENGISNNILIMQENGSAVPDDSARGRSVTFMLTSAMPFLFSGFSAIDDGTFQAYLGTDTRDQSNLLGELILTGESETGSISFAPVMINTDDKFTLVFGGIRSDGRLFSNSGGFDSLTYSQVPVPAALPLLVTGLLGLGFVRKRRQAAAAA